jgi:hypothetical protein
MTVTFTITSIRVIGWKQRTRRRHKVISPWTRQQFDRQYASILRERRYV